MRASKPMSVVKLKAKQSLQPFTADRNNAMGQSESTGVKCGKIHAGMSRLVWFYFSKVEEVARVCWPITVRSSGKLMQTHFTFDAHLKSILQQSLTNANKNNFGHPTENCCNRAFCLIVGFPKGVIPSSQFSKIV